MSMLAELVEVVIGVDTHKHTHTAAVVDARTGAVIDRVTVTADPDGYTELVTAAGQHCGLRAWAMEGSAGYGAGPGWLPAELLPVEDDSDPRAYTSPPAPAATMPADLRLDS